MNVSISAELERALGSYGKRTYALPEDRNIPLHACGDDSAVEVLQEQSSAVLFPHSLCRSARRILPSACQSHRAVFLFPDRGEIWFS